MKQNTCCFTGHRLLPVKKIQQIVTKLNEEVDLLIQKGVTIFISGGTLGFDQIAASLVVAKKQQGAKTRLRFALPYRNQDEKWTEKQKCLYHSLLGEADDIIYVSEEYTDGCMKERTSYMIDNSAYCICAYKEKAIISKTGKTIRHAQEKGLQIINVIR